MFLKESSQSKTYGRDNFKFIYHNVRSFVPKDIVSDIVDFDMVGFDMVDFDLFPPIIPLVRYSGDHPLQANLFVLQSLHRLIVFSRHLPFQTPRIAVRHCQRFLPIQIIGSRLLLAIFGYTTLPTLLLHQPSLSRPQHRLLPPLQSPHRIVQSFSLTYTTTSLSFSFPLQQRVALFQRVVFVQLSMLAGSDPNRLISTCSNWMYVDRS